MDPFEARLSDDLERITARQPFAPDVAAIEQRGRQIRRHRTAYRGAAGFGVAASATALVLVLASAQPSTLKPQHTATGPERTTTGAAQPRTTQPGTRLAVKTIVAKTIAAVSAAQPTSLLQVTSTLSSGDVSTVQFTSDAPDQVVEAVYENSSGQPVRESALRLVPGSQSGQYQMREIDFTAHTYTEDDNLQGANGGQAIPNPATAFLDQLQQDRQPGNPQGPVVLEGTTTVDGQAADILEFPGPSGTTQPTTGAMTMWVSQATSLPIKSVSSGTTVTYQWSAPSPGTAAGLWPNIPAGFTNDTPPVPGTPSPAVSRA
jgi:hypothetical protein